MKLIICSVRDRATEVFSRPFYVATAAQAIRTFTDEVNRSADDNQFNKHPNDFDLYELGLFNDETGSTDDLALPRLLISGVNAKL
jgi:hypothetical protein